MSERSSSLRSLLQTQQTLVSNGRDLVESTLQVPFEMNAAARQSLDRQRTVQREALEATHTTLSGTLDTVDDATPETATDIDEVRGAIDEGFETLLEGHDDLFDDVEERNTDAVMRLNEAVTDLLEQVEELAERNEVLAMRAADAVPETDDVVAPKIGPLDEVLQRQFGDIDAVVSPVTEQDADSMATDRDSEATDRDESSARDRIDRQREQIDQVRARIEALQEDLQETVEQGQDQAETDDGDPE